MASPDDLMLIREVQRYENLYNSELPQHSDKELIQQTWQNIANTLNADVSVCRTSWKRLRDCFVRVRKGGTKGRKPKWKYYDDLMFLAHHVKHRTTTTNNNFPSTNSNCDEMSDEFRDEEDSKFSDEYVTETPTQVVTPVTSLTLAPADMQTSWPYSQHDENGEPFAKHVKVEPQYEAQDVSMSESYRNDGTIAVDHLDDFGKSIASTLRQLSRRTQSWARRKIAEVLYEAEESEYQQMMASLPGAMPVVSMEQQPTIITQQLTTQPQQTLTIDAQPQVTQITTQPQLVSTPTHHIIATSTPQIVTTMPQQLVTTSATTISPITTIETVQTTSTVDTNSLRVDTTIDTNSLHEDTTIDTNSLHVDTNSTVDTNSLHADTNTNSPDSLQVDTSTTESSTIETSALVITTAS